MKELLYKTIKDHDIISCDFLPTKIPGNHYRGDIFDIIKDGFDIINEFDLIIAHPPCTYLSLSGNRWLKDNKKVKEI